MELTASEWTDSFGMWRRPFSDSGADCKMEPSGKISPTWRVLHGCEDPGGSGNMWLAHARSLNRHHQTRSPHGGPTPRQLCRTSLTMQKEPFQGCTGSTTRAVRELLQ